MTRRPERREDGTYLVKGKVYKELFGSREQVWNGTAYKTKYGMTVDDIIQNKHGRLVSAVKHKTASKEQRLKKYGFFTRKGKFGYVKKTPLKTGGLRQKNKTQKNVHFSLESETVV